MDEYDVDAYITSDMTEIRADQFIQRCRENRYRFSLAHELAHLLIHREIFKQLTFATIAEWKAAMESMPEDQYGWIEWQAYALAGLILVPRAALAALFQDQAAKAEAAGINLNSLDKEARKYIESNLGRSHFNVSGEVIARRMAKDGLWRD